MLMKIKIKNLSGNNAEQIKTYHKGNLSQMLISPKIGNEMNTHLELVQICTKFFRRAMKINMNATEN